MNSVTVEVIGVSQDLDFETGKMANFLLMRSNGKSFRAAVEDEVAQFLITTASNGGTELPQRMAVETGDDGSDMFSFGGDQEPQVIETTVSPAEAGVRRVAQQYVERDDMGNPVVRASGVDPGEVMEADADEGVPSI
jgi:hypothetical protein